MPVNRSERTSRTPEAVPVHAPGRALAAAPTGQAARPGMRPHTPTAVRRLLESPVLRPGLDVLGLGSALALTLRRPGEPVPLGAGWPLLLFGPLAMLLLLGRGMYGRRLRSRLLDGVVPIVGSISIAAMAVVVVESYVVPSAVVSAVVAHVWACAILAVGGLRTALVAAQRVARRRGLDGRPTLIVGAGAVGRRLARRLAEQPQYGLTPVGFLDADPLHDGDPGPDVPVLGSPDDLDWVAQVCGAEHVVVAFSSEPDERLVELVRRCEALGLEVSLVPRLFESLNHRATYEPLGGTPLVGLRSIRPNGWQFLVKHALDRVVAALLLVLLAPVLLAIAISVRASSPGPVLFRQRRVGRDGTVFDLYKFRSMRPDGADAGFRPGAGSAPGGVEGDDRRTMAGRLLRRTSLDELPQLLNVLRGEMSLVGPRPERPEFVELFESDLKRYGARHRVRSGLTGWAQVHGLRGQTSLADRVEWDNYYIEHWSLGLDLRILVLTVVAVLRPSE
jgi:exopolysaccharide biosynthesis polyprenyl glycosylphosphotransferase